MRTLTSLLLVSVLTASFAGMAPAFADDWHGDHHESPRGNEIHGERHEERHSEGREVVRWHDHDIHHFHDHDYDFWRGGRWFHGPHFGRLGWWWIVDSTWYFYPSPIYPYPDPYTPPTVILSPVEPTPLEASPNNVYYCQNPAGYYPYVAQCYGAWHRMPAVAEVEPPMQQYQGPVVDRRDMDDRRLNALAVEFEGVEPHGRSAWPHLKDLEQRVADFREELYSRGYNATDILRDADHLEHRIAAAREGLPH